MTTRIHIHVYTCKMWLSRRSVPCTLSLQVVDVNLTSEGKVKLEPGMELPFTYQVCVCVCMGGWVDGMCVCVCKCVHGCVGWIGV